MQSFVQSYGYFALIVLSILESACAPIPSEVTFGFAGAFCTVAVGGSSHFSVWAVIAIGTVGSLVGSIIAYETWLGTGDDDLLESIRAYNEENCTSTLSLRDWLLGTYCVSGLVCAWAGGGR